MAFDNRMKEAAAEAAYEDGWGGGSIEILNGGAAVIASGAVPATNDADLGGSPDGSVSNDAIITIAPSSSDTAVTVQIKDSGGTVRSSYTASAVMNSTNVVLGQNITIAIGDLTATVT